MGTKLKKRSHKKSKSVRIAGKNRSNLTLLLLVFVLAALLLLVVSQRMSADAVTTASSIAAYKEVGTINYSLKVVDKVDNGKSIPGQAVTVYTNGSTKLVENLTSGADGMVSGGTYSICTKDSNLYTIMTKGCVQKVTKITVSTKSGTVLNSGYAKKSTVSVASGSYIEPQFREKFVSVTGGTATGIAGQWAMPISMLYSDGSGVRVMENKLTANKAYEVGTLDVSVLVVDKKDKTKVVSDQYVSVEPATITYRTVTKWFKKKKVPTSTNLPNLKTKGVSSAAGVGLGGRYSICANGSLRYYIMDAGCKNKIGRLSIYLTDAAGTKLPKAKTFAQGLNKTGSGYTLAEFLKAFGKKDGTASNEIKGEWKTKNSTLIYSNGTGGKSF